MRTRFFHLSMSVDRFSRSRRVFLDDHVATLASIDFFTVATFRFGLLHVFLVRAHDRRKVVHLNATADPTAEWAARQISEGFPENTPPRSVIRDRDGVYGDFFRGRAEAIGIREALIAPRSACRIRASSG